MKINLIAVMTAMITCTGCTTFALEQYTLRQNTAAGDGRDTVVMNCLAAVAADPDTLPPYALFSNGIPSVTDAFGASHATGWAPKAYTTETLTSTGSRAPKGQFTVDPVGEYQQLEALHAACLWALFGPERAMQTHPGVLGNPNDYLDGKIHFAVEKRLRRMGPAWVHVGRQQDVPACALRTGHKDHTWVWAMPEDSEALAQFTLTLQDIATLDPTLYASPPILITLTTYNVTNLPDLGSGPDGKKNVAISTTDRPRLVKKEHKKEIEDAIKAGINGKDGKVNLTRAQWLAYTDYWPGIRNTSGTPAIPAGAPAPAVSGAPAPMILLSPTLPRASFGPLQSQ